MPEINVSDRVRVSKVNGEAEKPLLNRVGLVMMVVDGVRCVVAFPDGSAATLSADQLVKAS